LVGEHVAHVVERVRRGEVPAIALHPLMITGALVVGTTVGVRRLGPRDHPGLIASTLERPAVHGAVDIGGVSSAADLPHEILRRAPDREVAGGTATGTLPETVHARAPPCDLFAQRWPAAPGSIPDGAYMLGHPDNRSVDVEEAFRGPDDTFSGADA